MTSISLIIRNINSHIQLFIHSGTRTLNAVRSSQQYQHDYHSNNNSNNMWHRTSNSAKDRRFLATTPNDTNINNIDDMSDLSNASSGDGGVRARVPDMVLFKAAHSNSDANAQNSASSGDSSTSMLVAEHGFVRFRPMEMENPMEKNSDNNNKNSPAIMQRHHKRSLTNS